MADSEKNKGGRPSKFTPERRARLIAALEDGNHIETACAVAGVGYSTYREWMLAGERGEEGFAEFRDDVTRALAHAEESLISTVRTHSADDWRAASWILERRHPDRWANTQRVRIEVEKEIRAVLDALESKMSPGAYDELVNALASMGQGRTNEDGAEGDEAR